MQRGTRPGARLTRKERCTRRRGPTKWRWAMSLHNDDALTSRMPRIDQQGPASVGIKAAVGVWFESANCDWTEIGDP